MAKQNIKAKASNSVKPVAKKIAPKVAKPAKPVKEKLKKGKKKPELDEDLLVGESDEVGAEELPDLSDFEENETVDAQDSDDLLLTAAADVRPSGEDEVILTDAEGRRLCRVRDCDQAATVEAYCRFHYLLNWKKIQVRRKILTDGKLSRYVDELTSRYPDKFLEMIRKDLRAEKDFLAAIAELEIDEAALDNEYEEESQTFIDEVRGVSADAGSMSDDDDF